MKTGDKLICKKDLINKWHKYIKGNEYEIEVLGNSTILIHRSKDVMDNMAFNIDKDFIDDYYHIWDYFCTKEEFRQLKLNSL